MPTRLWQAVEGARRGARSRHAWRHCLTTKWQADGAKGGRFYSQHLQENKERGRASSTSMHIPLFTLSRTVPVHDVHTRRSYGPIRPPGQYRTRQHDTPSPGKRDTHALPPVGDRRQKVHCPSHRRCCSGEQQPHRPKYTRAFKHTGKPAKTPHSPQQTNKRLTAAAHAPRIAAITNQA